MSDLIENIMQDTPSDMLERPVFNAVIDALDDEYYYNFDSRSVDCTPDNKRIKLHIDGGCSELILNISGRTIDADLVVCLGSKHCVTQSDLAEYLEYVVSKSIELDNKSCE